eukprot:scaffold22147_cov98-Skeletonema_dohrnii-CCMP3373.AAC.1
MKAADRQRWAAQLRKELSGGGGGGGGRCVGGGWGGCYYCELGVMYGGGAEMMFCVACPKFCEWHVKLGLKKEEKGGDLTY